MGAAVAAKMERISRDSLGASISGLRGNNDFAFASGWSHSNSRSLPSEI
jgi:hypothetical protein